MSTKSKKAAIELSVGTIVIIVIGVSMLILGMVLVRSIMCKAIGLTDDVNAKVSDELNRYFGDTGAEVACVGSGGEPVKLIAGKTNTIFCTLRVTEKAKYQINLVQYKSFINTLKDEQLKSWIKASSWSADVAPGDQSIKKVVTMQIPSNAPEGPIRLQLEVKKDGNLISTQDLDFEISRVGLVRNSIC